MLSDSAESACISPSISRSGSTAKTNSRALAILRDDSVERLPKLECESRATRGVIPKRRTSFTASNVILATSSAVGFSRSEEHTSELQSRGHLVCRLLLEQKNSVV